MKSTIEYQITMEQDQIRGTVGWVGAVVRRFAGNGNAKDIIQLAEVEVKVKDGNTERAVAQLAAWVETDMRTRLGSK